jgi:saccharopine dehydrogenase (NADP+, L-glutamate forming)
LILDGKITQKGVLAPMTPELCDPILKALEEQGIFMVEAIV